MSKSILRRYSHLAAALALAGACTLAGAVPQSAFTVPLPEKSALGAGEAAYAKGLKALDNNDLPGAETAFKEALAADPKLFAAALGMADVAVRRGRLEEVRNWLDQARKMRPNSVEVETAWARYYFSQRDYAKAESLLKNAAKLDPQAFLPRIDIATLYLNQLNNPRQAIEAYRDAIRVRPTHAGAHFGLGMALAGTGDTANALLELQESARLDQANPLPWRGIAQVHAGQRRYDEAIKAYTTAIKLQPGFAPFYLERGEIFDVSGDAAKALADYEQAIKIDGKLADAHARKGMVFQRTNKSDEAQKAYLAAIALNPKHALAYNNLAWMAAEQKTRLDDALKWATIATEIAPKQALFFDTLGWVYRARGDLARAASTLEKAVGLAPKYADAHYHLGVVYGEQNQTQRAAAMLNKALALDPNFPSAADARRRLAALGGK